MNSGPVIALLVALLLVGGLSFRNFVQDKKVADSRKAADDKWQQSPGAKQRGAGILGTPRVLQGICARQSVAMTCPAASEKRSHSSSFWRSISRPFSVSW